MDEKSMALVYILYPLNIQYFFFTHKYSLEAKLKSSGTIIYGNSNVRNRVEYSQCSS